MRKYSSILTSVKTKIALITVVLFLTTTAVYAGATWHSTNGPNENGSDWVLTGTATLSSPHHHVCMNVTVPEGPNAGSFTLLCSGTSNFTCSVPRVRITGSSVPVSWRLHADSASHCGGNQTTGSPPTSGTFPMSPTAISLLTMETTAINSLFANAPGAFIAIGFLALSGLLTISLLLVHIKHKVSRISKDVN